MIPKVDELRNERGIYIADEHKAFLDHLAATTDKKKNPLGVFQRQLDAWAFAAAYAMSKHTTQEPPPTPKKKEQLTALGSILSADLLTALLEADNYLSSTTGWEVVTESRAAAQRLSDWASLGLNLLEKEWEGRGREQIRRMILVAISPSRG